MHIAGENLESGQQRRILWLLIVMGMVGVYVYGHLAAWQLFARTSDLPSYTPQDVVIPARRGAIYDATGHALALSDVQYEMDVTPRLLANSQIARLVPALSQILGIHKEGLYQVITNTNPTSFYVLGRELPPQVKRDMDALAEEIMTDPDKSKRFTLSAFVL